MLCFAQIKTNPTRNRLEILRLCFKFDAKRLKRDKCAPCLGAHNYKVAKSGRLKRIQKYYIVKYFFSLR